MLVNVPRNIGKLCVWKYFRAFREILLTGNPLWTFLKKQQQRNEFRVCGFDYCIGQIMERRGRCNFSKREKSTIVLKISEKKIGATSLYLFFIFLLSFFPFSTLVFCFISFFFLFIPFQFVLVFTLVFKSFKKIFF